MSLSTKNYLDDLQKHHGGKSIALSTVSEYMGQEEPKAKKGGKPIKPSLTCGVDPSGQTHPCSEFPGCP